MVHCLLSIGNVIILKLQICVHLKIKIWFRSVLYIFLFLTNGCPKCRPTSQKSGGGTPRRGVRSRARSLVVVIFNYICLGRDTEARLRHLFITYGTSFSIPLHILRHLACFFCIRENSPCTAVDFPRMLHRTEIGSLTFVVRKSPVHRLHSYQFYLDMIGRVLTYFYVVTLIILLSSLLKRIGRFDLILRILSYPMFINL